MTKPILIIATVMREASTVLLLEKQWALLDIEFIKVTATHRCIRKMYILAKNGYDNLETEFYPCKRYKDLDRKYQKCFRFCRAYIHQLSYNPKTYAPSCRQVLSLLKKFIMNNNIELMLYKGGTIERDLCTALDIPSMNIECLQGIQKVHSHDPCTEVNSYFSQIVEIVSA